MVNYNISKVLNNNVVIVCDEKDRELIALGGGVGFGKKRGEYISDEDMEKKFIAADSEDLYKKLFNTLTRVSVEYVDIVDYTVEIVKKDLGIKLNPQIYVLLMDHLSFAVERAKEHLNLSCPMLAEIKIIYKNEYNVAKKVLDYCEKKLHIRLPSSEAGFIAMHIMNATNCTSDINQTLDVMVIVNGVVRIIKEYYQIEFEENSLDYLRLLTHLNFFAKLIVLKQMEENDQEVIELLQGKYLEAQKCVDEIVKYVKENFGYTISEQERIYLAIHINRNVKKK